MPLICLTTSDAASVGNTRINKWIWSGSIANSIIFQPFASHLLSIISLHRTAISPIKTLLRRLGVQIKWKTTRCIRCSSLWYSIQMLTNMYLIYYLSTNKSREMAKASNRLTTAPKGSVACGGLKPQFGQTASPVPNSCAKMPT